MGVLFTDAGVATRARLKDVVACGTGDEVVAIGEEQVPVIRRRLAEMRLLQNGSAAYPTWWTRASWPRVTALHPESSAPMATTTYRSTGTLSPNRQR